MSGCCGFMGCGFGLGSPGGSGSGAVSSVAGSDGITPVAPQTGAVVLSGLELVPRDGSRALTGDWNVGGFDLFNGSFNGVALTTSGSANEFLNAAGAYVPISGGAINTAANVGGEPGEVFRNVAPADTINLRTLGRAPTLATAVETQGDIIRLNVQSVPIVESFAELLALPGTSVVGSPGSQVVTVTDSLSVGALISVPAGDRIVFRGDFLVGLGNNAFAGAGFQGDFDGALFTFDTGSNEVRDVTLTNANAGLFSGAVILEPTAFDLVCHNVTFTGANCLRMQNGSGYVELENCYLRGGANSAIDALQVANNTQHRLIGCYFELEGEGCLFGQGIRTEIQDCYFVGTGASVASAISLRGSNHLITGCRLDDTPTGTLATFLNLIPGFGAASLTVDGCDVAARLISGRGPVENSVFSNIRCLTGADDPVASDNLTNCSFSNIIITGTGPGAAFQFNDRALLRCRFSDMTTESLETLLALSNTASASECVFQGNILNRAGGAGPRSVLRLDDTSQCVACTFVANNVRIPSPDGVIVDIAPGGGGTLGQITTSTFCGNYCRQPIRLNGGATTVDTYLDSVGSTFRGNVSGNGPLLDFPYQYEQLQVNAGALLPRRPSLNLIQAGASAVDNPTFNRTDVTLAAGSGGPRRFYQTFSLIEQISNTVRFFYAAQTQDPPTNLARSGNSFDLGYANNPKCSPFLVPEDATIIAATARLGNVGVSNGSVSYPVRYRAAVFRIDPTNITLLGNLDFQIPSVNPVGTFNTNPLTDFRGSLAQNIPVLQGDLIGIEFMNGAGASEVSLQECCYVSLTFEV